jgi:hypothetical protein
MGIRSAPARDSRDPLRQYARDTWSSFVAMTDAQSGLPADSLSADGTRSVQTSTTNIGAYMWSALVAERLGLITHAEAAARLSTTIGTLEHMERYQPGGQFYNWYDHRTGAKLTVWPPTGAALTPIVSSVDDGWLATGLRLVQRSVPELAARPGALFDSMDFGFLLPAGRQPNRLLLRAQHRRVALLLRHDRQRKSHLQLHRDRQGRDPAEGVLRHLALVPRHL